MQRHPATSRVTAVLATLVTLATCAACDSEPADEGPSADPTGSAGAEPADEQPPPEAPAVEALDAPADESARVARPEWSVEHRRFEWEVQGVPAVFGTSDTVTQILLGEEPAEGIMLTFYGHDLRPGQYDVLPATDETRAEHAGKDSGVFIVAVGKAGEDDMRSESGTVTIERADDDTVVGSFDIVARARIRRTSAAVRARFSAGHDDFMDALLEHEAAIREQLRRH